MTKRNPEATPRMFTKVIGDEVYNEYEKKINEAIRQQSLTLLERINEKQWKFRTASLKTLSTKNKTSDKSENIKSFIAEVLNQIIVEFNALTTKDVFAALEKDMQRAIKLKEMAIEKNIKDFKLPYEYYKSIKGTSANIKMLNWIVQNFSTHVEVIVKHDFETGNNAQTATESFLNGIQSLIPVLYSRFAELVVQKNEHLQRVNNAQEI